MVFRVVLFQMVGGYQHFGGPVLNAEGRGSMILWNVCVQPPHCIVQQPRKSQILSSQLWKPHISEKN